eukprot:9900379-Ditylum_brightwellii.AAC.1
MKSADITMAEHLASIESSRILAENMAKILDSKYSKVNVQTDIVNHCTTLNTKDKEKLLPVLQKDKEILHSTLGIRKGLQYDIEPQP